MPPLRLQTRFILAGCLLVATTIGSGLWSAVTFADLGAAADNALRASQGRLERSAELAGALEREDDALLLALGGDRDRSDPELSKARQRVEDGYELLAAVLGGDNDRGQSLVKTLRKEIDDYHKAGSALIKEGKTPGAMERYQQKVNPVLRRAVAACGAIRDESVEALRLAGARARDVAERSTWVVSGISLAALALATVVAIWLARSVLRPVRALTESVEAVRLGDFDRRVTPSSRDELGQLAEGFNRMAETLCDYRASSLGELLTAKFTLEATLNALPDGVLVVDPDGALATVNPPARAVLGALRAPEAARLQEVPLPPEQRAAVDAALAGRPSVPTRAEFGQALAAVVDGRPRRFLLAAVPIPEFAPRRFGAAVVLEDVTEFARLDELRGELIGLASHELKSPLTALQLNLMLLAEEATDLPPARRELLDAALAGCRELADTISGMLDLTRAEAGQLRLDLAPVDLAALLDRVLRGMRPRLDAARVRVEVTRDTTPALVRGDAARLGNVLTNLLGNALKYSPPGGTVTVRFAAAPPTEAGGPPAVRVSVTDEGPGVPAEFRERVFEKFFRVEHHRAGPGGAAGTGIGLYLCREIVNAHGGSIRCEAGDGGVGTRFVLTLPAAGAPA